MADVHYNGIVVAHHAIFRFLTRVKGMPNTPESRHKAARISYYSPGPYLEELVPKSVAKRILKFNQNGRYSVGNTHDLLVADGKVITVLTKEMFHSGVKPWRDDDNRKKR